MQSSDGVESFPLGFGFGYDPKSNAYKVVRILTFIAEPAEVASVKVEMYTLSTDSWREFTFMEPFEAGIRHLLSFECRCFRGVCYWMARGNFRDNNVSHPFGDVSDEIFGKISVP